MSPEPWLLRRISHPAHHWPLAPSGKRALTEPVTEYVVVDELEEEVAVVVIEPWPALDRHGRLDFHRPDARLSVEVDPQALQILLTDRLPAVELTSAQRMAFVLRPLRVGDVYCAVVDREVLAETPDVPADWLRQPVVDVTAQAREAAKSQYYAAIGPVLTTEEVDSLAADFYAQEEEGDGG